MEQNHRIKNTSEKEWVKDQVHRDVAMATTLAPVSSSFNLN